MSSGLPHPPPVAGPFPGNATRPLFKRPALWAVATLVALGLTVFAVWLLPHTVPVVALDIRMDRQMALREAERLARDYGWGPSGAMHSSAVFVDDPALQAFIGLEGGGRNALVAATRQGFLAPNRWVVRRFQAGEPRQVLIHFTPEGLPWGFEEKLPETFPGAALAGDAARRLAEDAARGAPWHVAFGQFEFIGESQERRPNGRVDHTFTYERLNHRLGEGRYRLTLAVSGNRLTALLQSVKPTASFERQYAELRAEGQVLARTGTLALFIVGLLLLPAFGLAHLVRRRSTLPKPALAATAILAALLLVHVWNGWPAVWHNYDSAQPLRSFEIGQLTAKLAEVLGLSITIFLALVIGEGLVRHAFPAWPQFWRLGATPVASSNSVLRLVLGAYLLTPVIAVLQLGFIWGSVHMLGWWLPPEIVVDPNILASRQPWYSLAVAAVTNSIAIEFIFRAIPLAGAAMLGDRWGGRRALIPAALVGQAVLSGLVASNLPHQPAYARVIEAAVPAVFFGVVFLRGGLLSALLIHYLYDLGFASGSVFAASGSGIWFDRGMVVILAFAPLGYVLARRWRPESRDEVPAACLNGGWELPPDRPAAGTADRQRPAPEARPPRIGILVLLGILGAAMFLLFGTLRTKAEIPVRVTVARADAEARARVRIASRDAEVTPEWQVTSRLVEQEDPAYQLVWQTGGRAAYVAALSDGTLPGPYWLVRLLPPERPRPESLDEWQAEVPAAGGEFVRIRHLLPPGRPGGSLDADAARLLALAALQDTFQTPSNRFAEVSLTSDRLPHRSDWTFVYRHAPAAGPTEPEMRYTVRLSGNEVSDVSRTLFVPEAWLQAQRQVVSYRRLITIVHSLTVIGISVALVWAAIIAWRRGRIELRSIWTTAALVWVTTAMIRLNGWLETTSRLEASWPRWQQSLETAAREAVLAPLLVALVLALSLRLSLSWLSELPVARPAPGSPWGWGLAAGLVWAAYIVGAGCLHAMGAPEWRSLAAHKAVWPWATIPLDMIYRFLATSTLSLLGLTGLSRATDNWARRHWLWGGTVFGVAAVYSVDATLPVGPVMAALALLGGLLPLLGFLLMRQGYLALPVAAAVMLSLRTLRDVWADPDPGALLGSALGLLAVAVLSRWWIRRIQAAAAAPATADSAEPVA